MPATKLKFFIAILFFAFCTSGCSKKSETSKKGETIESKKIETIEPLPADNATCKKTDGEGRTVEFNCQAGYFVDCNSEIKPSTPIEALGMTGYYSLCWVSEPGALALSRRGVAILPILIKGLYDYPDNSVLLDIIIKMGPDAADTAPHLIRLLDKYSNQNKNFNKVLRALASLGEDGTVAIPYLIDRLNYLRNNQGSPQDIEEITSYLAELGKFQPEAVQATLLDLTKDQPTTARNALALIATQANVSNPPWADSNTFGVYTKSCQAIYEKYSKTPTSSLLDHTHHQPYAYCIANILGKRGMAALPELTTMANSDDVYLRFLAVKYIGKLGDAVDAKTREKIISFKNKEGFNLGQFLWGNWDVDYYMLGQPPEFRN